jgi:hypothetical protein
MTYQQTTTESIDYLAINRARWDERAPHVRTLANTTATFPCSPQQANLTHHSACQIARLPNRHSPLKPNLLLQHPDIRPLPPPKSNRKESRPPPMPHRNRHPLARPPRSRPSRRPRSQPCQSARSAETSFHRGGWREIVFRRRRCVRCA